MEKIKIKVKDKNDLLTVAKILVDNGYTVKKGSVPIPGKKTPVAALIAWEGCAEVEE